MIKQLVDFKTTRLTEATLKVEIPTLENSEWMWRLLVLSDLHWDHPRCDRRFLLRLLKEAIEVNAGIIITGDIFCAMSGREDHRWERDEVRPEYIGKRGHFKEMINDCSAFLKPFASHIICISEGNHETKHIKKHDRELIVELVEKMNEGSPYTVHGGEYSGLIDLVFKRSNGHIVNKILCNFHHGGYTTDAQKISRMQYYPDCDIFTSGHNHDLDIKPYARVRVLPSGKLYKDHQWFIQVPSLKDDFGDGTGGFPIECKHRPKVLGAVKIDFNYIRDAKKVKPTPIPCV